MAGLTMMDQYHIALLVPKGLNTAESELIWKAINDVSFSKELRRAVRLIVRLRPDLNKVQIRISR
jgi:hypothetical protein